jgi:hypothetical protein
MFNILSVRGLDMDIQVVLNQMIQLFLILGLGYFLFKINILDEDFNKKLNRLILNVTTPAMIISSVTGNSETNINTLLFVFVIAVIVYIALPIIGYVVVKLMRIPKRQQGLYIFMTVFSNIGFMGFPVMKSIFGQEAVFYTAIFNMIFNILVYSLGIVLINYGKDTKVKYNKKDLLSPGIIASLIAIIIYLSQITLPSVIVNCLSMVGDTTTPLAMMMIGATLGTINIKNVFNELRMYPYTIIKQIIIPIISYPILAYFIKDPLILGITLINIAMPVGNSAVIFSYAYDGDVELAAKGVFITTLMSIITIPLIVSLFLV